jgi:hypothetical protein
MDCEYNGADAISVEIKDTELGIDPKKIEQGI